MNTMLKVTPEKLIETAEEFSNAGSGIRSLTQEMISIVDSFKPVWQGEAATGFANKFAMLAEDMNRLYSMIQKHAEALLQMAAEYRDAESESENIALSLATEVIN